MGPANIRPQKKKICRHSPPPVTDAEAELTTGHIPVLRDKSIDVLLAGNDGLDGLYADGTLECPKRAFRLRLGRRFLEHFNVFFTTKNLQLVYPPLWQGPFNENPYAKLRLAPF